MNEGNNFIDWHKNIYQQKKRTSFSRFMYKTQKHDIHTHFDIVRGIHHRVHTIIEFIRYKYIYFVSKYIFSFHLLGIPYASFDADSQ